jgi:hypothetical protein
VGVPLTEVCLRQKHASHKVALTVGGIGAAGREFLSVDKHLTGVFEMATRVLLAFAFTQPRANLSPVTYSYKTDLFRICLNCGENKIMKIVISSFLASILLLAGSCIAVAQDDGMLIIPVELFACTYNDGKGPGDLDKVIARWNKWADKQGVDDYAAWTLTPYYFGPEQEFDVIWLGAGKDAVALGKAQDSYMGETDGLHAAFNEVISCNAHSNFASINFKAAPKGKAPKNSVITFSDCNFKDGATFEALGSAMGQWSQHLSDGGSEAGIFHWYQAYGGGKEELDFKWLEVHKNFAALGADYERYGNGRGFETRRSLLGHLISCDSRRAYVAQSRRFVQLR